MFEALLRRSTRGEHRIVQVLVIFDRSDLFHSVVWLVLFESLSRIAEPPTSASTPLEVPLSIFSLLFWVLFTCVLLCVFCLGERDPVLILQVVVTRKRSEVLCIELLIEYVCVLVLDVFAYEFSIFETFLADLAAVSLASLRRYLTCLYLTVLVLLLNKQVVFLRVLQLTRALVEDLIRAFYNIMAELFGFICHFVPCQNASITKVVRRALRG